MSRKSADQRRIEFIDAAVRVIANGGIGDATTRRIAEEADAPLASLHYCFHTKEQLFWAVWARFRDEFASGPLRSMEASGLSLAESAAQVLRLILEWMQQNPDYAIAQYDLYQWALRRGDSPYSGSVNDLFVDNIEAALRASAASPDEDAAAIPLSRFIMAISDGLTIAWNGHQDQERFAAESATAMAMVRAYAHSVVEGASTASSS